jgi:hypothetical protein
MADAQASGPANQRPAASASGATATGGPNKDGPAGFPLGGMGAGADQKGEDKTHTTNWRVEGQLFGETDPVATFNGVVGTEPAKER